ncbi:MAG: hypothetical protein ABSE51_19460 [Terracidiphilus sp.]|jgi:hypothetical protein
MNTSNQKNFVHDSGAGEFEATLRLIAQLPAPNGLEDRVQAGLHAGTSPASGTASRRGRILAWPVALRLDNNWMRSAAAAAIVSMVVGGGWVVSSRIRPSQSARVINIAPHVAAPGGFSSAGAMRTPQTLNGPIVENPVVAHPVAAAPQTTKPSVKPAVRGKQTQLHRAAKPATANTAISQPVASAAK